MSLKIEGLFYNLVKQMMNIEEEDEDALNDYYIAILKEKHIEKVKGRVHVNMPYQDAKVLKHRFDLYWNKMMKKWMCLEKDYDDIMLLITEKADVTKN